MKIKKSLLLLASLLSLTSCGEKQIDGVYSFQLGKDGGTHFGVYLNLTNEIFKEGKTGKKFELSFDADLKSMESMGSHSLIDIEKIKQLFPEFVKDDKLIIDGYYLLSGRLNRLQEEILAFGLDLDKIYDAVARAYKEETGDDFPISKEDFLEIIKDDLVEDIIYASYKTETVNLYVPVSLEDAYLQLYWYGYDIRLNLGSVLSDLNFKSREPESEEQNNEKIIEVIVNEDWVTNHELGSHPTDKAYIEHFEEFKAVFDETHKDQWVTTFRDYYTLQMGMIKR